MKPRTTKPTKPTTATTDLTETLIGEARTYAAEAAAKLIGACEAALLAGLRLMWLHQQELSTAGRASGSTGFQASLAKIDVPRRTAYRWINAAAHVLAKHFNLTEAENYELPKPGSRDWAKAEKILRDSARGMTLHRLQLGAASKGETHRLDELITRSEDGDQAADAALEAVEKGELTLVQAIRAAAGAAATKNKSRRDPVYLDLDSCNGKPTGLFFRSMVTIANTFANWDKAPEGAREAARTTWKELVRHLPPDLR